ncbi:MAG: hypothetical protein MN733_44405 [Nitrososphaera sp.]|nr:hypothetical protein [Nitrososphaera sp.]
MSLLDAILLGARHSLGQVRDDASSILKGDVNSDIAFRLLDVLGELPLGRAAKGVQRLLGEGRNLDASPLLLGITAPAGRVFHGSTSVIDKIDPRRNVGDATLLRGPGFYVSTSPEVVGAPFGSYAAGSTRFGPDSSVDKIVQLAADRLMLARLTADKQKAAELLRQADELRPNVLPFQQRAHNTFDVQNFPKEDQRALLNAVLAFPFADKVTKHGTTTGAQRAKNLAALLGEGQETLPSGETVFKTLQDTVGGDLANEIIRNAGFQSIKHPGGLILGAGKPHTAFNVLDEEILEPFVDFAAARKAARTARNVEEAFEEIPARFEEIIP